MSTSISLEPINEKNGVHSLKIKSESDDFALIDVKVEEITNHSLVLDGPEIKYRTVSETESVKINIKQESDIDNSEEEDDGTYEDNESENHLADDYSNDAVDKGAEKATIHQCIHCSFSTKMYKVLKRHLKTHFDGLPFKCSVCQRGFKGNATLLNHMNKHFGDKPHCCTECDLSFYNPGELKRHYQYKHTVDRPFKCTECDYGCFEQCKLKIHMRCHSSERPFKCPHCTYASPDNFKLKRHLLVHTGEKPYACTVCHARFTQSNGLKTHMYVHGGDRPTFHCSFCPVTCGRYSDLRTHLQKMHHSDQPIICKLCHMELPDRYSYKLHRQSHVGEKCYHCKFCEYAGVSSRHLKSHMLTHTGRKKFPCEHCSSSFRTRSLLNRHIMFAHNDVPNKKFAPPAPSSKNYKCPHCSRLCANRGNLTRHMLVHSSEYKNTTAVLQTDASSGLDDYYSDGNDYVAVGIKEEQYDKGDAMECIDAGPYEIICADGEEIDKKPILIDNNTCKITSKELNRSIEPVALRKQHNRKELMSVQVEDGQQFVVFEVMQDDDSKEVLTGQNICKTEIDNCVDSGEKRKADTKFAKDNVNAFSILHS